MKGRRWRNRKQGWNGSTKQTRAMDNAALANAAQYKASFGPAGPARSLVTGKVYEPRTKPDVNTDSWRVVGSECPWNDKPGYRQVYHNGQLVSSTPVK